MTRDAGRPSARAESVSAAEVAGIARRLERVTGRGLPRMPLASPGELAEAVLELTRLASRALSHARDDDARAVASRALIDLQPLVLRLHIDATRSRSDRMEEVSRALARLRQATTTEELLGRVCLEIVGAGGFRRAVLSRISRDAWNPWQSFARERDLLDPWFAQWIDEPIPLDARSPERLSLTRRSPMLVPDTDAARVHRPIIVDAGASRSYVVVPVLAGEGIIGLLHADHSPDGPTVDETDRDAIWALATGIGLIWERTTLQERLRQQRSLAHDILLAAAEDIMTSAARIPVASTATVRTPETMGELTARERQVLELLADGASNQVIASRLVISTDTVKSHVKHILRKLNADNRAQAVAISLQAERR